MSHQRGLNRMLNLIFIFSLSVLAIIPTPLSADEYETEDSSDNTYIPPSEDFSHSRERESEPDNSYEESREQTQDEPAYSEPEQDSDEREGVERVSSGEESTEPERYERESQPQSVEEEN